MPETDQTPYIQHSAGVDLGGELLLVFIVWQLKINIICPVF